MNQQNATTCLTGKRDGITFELSVKIEGSPSKVYNEEDMDGGGSQAWIASEEAKRYTICCMVQKDVRQLNQPTRYPAFVVKCYSDGNHISSKLCLATAVTGSYVDITGRRLSKDFVQEMSFSKPELSEHALPGAASDKLGTIVAVFYRCLVYERVPYVSSNVGGRDSDEGNPGPINEKGVKRKMIGAVTKFGGLTASSVTTMSNYDTHPDDIKKGFFTLQFRYGPEDLLQALGHIPLKLAAKSGVTGLDKNRPIVCLSDDESEDEDDKTKVFISDRTRAKGKKEATADDAPEETAAELFELRAKLKALEEIAQLREKIEALEQGLGKKRKATEAGPSKAKVACVKKPRATRK